MQAEVWSCFSGAFGATRLLAELLPAAQVRQKVKQPQNIAQGLLINVVALTGGLLFIEELVLHQQLFWVGAGLCWVVPRILLTLKDCAVLHKYFDEG